MRKAGRRGCLKCGLVTRMDVRVAVVEEGEAEDEGGGWWKEEERKGGGADDFLVEEGRGWV